MQGCMSVALSSLLFFACSEATEIGSGLLQEDQADVSFLDTVSIRSQTVIGDSVLTFAPTGALTRHLLGRMNDPLFGLTETAFFFQFIPDSLGAQLPLDAVVDSVVLVLAYDTAGFYGNTAEPFGVEVVELAENLDVNQTYYSNSRRQTGPRVGQGTIFPRADSLVVNVFPRPRGVAAVRQVKSPAQARIRLNNAFGQRLLTIDSATVLRDSLFLLAFKGLCVKPTTTNRGMVGINLRSNTSRIVLYYRDNGVAKQFGYVLNFELSIGPALARGGSFSFNRDNTLLADALAQRSNDYVMIQGLSGTYGELDLAGLKNLRNVIVNQAELVLQVANVPGDLAAFTPAPQLALFYRNTDGRLQLIDDFAIASTNIATRFGGTFRAGVNGEPGTYRMLVSNHVQNILEGKINSTKIYLGTFPRAEQVDRVTLFRADHPTYPARLRLTFTQLRQ